VYQKRIKLNFFLNYIKQSILKKSYWFTILFDLISWLKFHFELNYNFYSQNFHVAKNCVCQKRIKLNIFLNYIKQSIKKKSHWFTIVFDLISWLKFHFELNYIFYSQNFHVAKICVYQKKIKLNKNFELHKKNLQQSFLYWFIVMFDLSSWFKLYFQLNYILDLQIFHVAKICGKQENKCAHVFCHWNSYNFEFQFGGNWIQILSVSRQTLLMGPISCV
jgi:hypothetical protein